MTVRIRLAAANDIPAIVAVHGLAFPGFFLTRLGEPFLAAYYRLILTSGVGMLLVAEQPPGRILGFIAGLSDPQRFYQSMRTQRTTFLFSILRTVLRNPSVTLTVLLALGRVRRSSRSNRPSFTASAELSSIGIIPESAGEGVGTRLLRAFEKECLANDIRFVYLTTDKHRNSVANDFYRRRGYHFVGEEMRSPRRIMNVYGRHLTESGSHPDA